MDSLPVIGRTATQPELLLSFEIATRFVLFAGMDDVLCSVLPEAVRDANQRRAQSGGVCVSVVLSMDNITATRGLVGCTF